MDFSDPDYDDFEFREQNPDIYGDDEVVGDHYGGKRRVHRESQDKIPEESTNTFFFAFIMLVCLVLIILLLLFH